MPRSNVLRKALMECYWAQRRAWKDLLEKAATPVDSKEQIKQEAMALFEKELDKQLERLREGERLGVVFRFRIMRENGELEDGTSDRNTKEYAEWRKAVFERDNYTCQMCGKRGELQAHHIKPYSKHPEARFDIDNGITLCVECHAKVHPHLKLVAKSRVAKGVEQDGGQQD